MTLRHRIDVLESTASARLLPVPELPAATAQDVCVLLADTIGRVRAGRMDPRVGLVVGSLAGQLVRAMEAAQVEDRLRALEAAVGGRGRGAQLLGDSCFDRPFAAALPKEAS